MAQLGRFDYTVQTALGLAVTGASVAVYREGATVVNNQSGTAPLAVTVFHAGKIQTGDTVFVNTATGTLYTATRTSATVVTLSGFVGTVNVSSGDRLTPSTSQPSLYGDDQAVNTVGSPRTTSSTGRANCWMEFGAYDFVVSGGGATTTAFTAQVTPSQVPGQVRFADEFKYGSSTGGIQEAINDLPTAGGTVVLSGGTTYSTSAAITVANDVHIRGAGVGASIVKGANGTTHSIFAPSSTSRISFRDLTVDGNSANRTTGSGISLTGTTDVRIENCAFQNIDLSGVRLENSTTTRTWIRNCKFTGCNANNSSGDACIQGHGNPAAHSYVWVENNYCDTYEDAAIRFDTATDIWISNNRVVGPFSSGEEGIVLGYGTRAVLEGNVVSDNNGSGILYGTSTLATTRGIRIANNLCYDNNNGIKVEWQATNAAITGLTLSGNVCYQAARTQNYGVLLSVAGGVLTPAMSDSVMIGNVLVGNGTDGFGTTGTAPPTAGLMRIYNVPENVVQQNITAAATAILANSLRVQLVADANYTLSATPTIASGYEGQMLEITCVDTVDTVTLQDQGTLPASNLRLGAATRALSGRDTLILRYDSFVGDWIEIGFSNVT